MVCNNKNEINDIEMMIGSAVNQFVFIKNCIQDILDRTEDNNKSKEPLISAIDSMDELISIIDSDTLDEIYKYLDESKEE